MRPLISPAAMRDMEARYFAESGVASIELMERAAAAMCRVLIERYGRGCRVAFACGPGGNGGDGWACARLYAQAGGRCVVAAAAEPRTPDAVENARRSREMGIDICSVDDAGQLTPPDPPDRGEAPAALDIFSDAPPDIWVDALYGTGLSRAPEGAAAALIRRMNADRARGSKVVAADIPSGLGGGDGRAFEPCVTADITCAFQYIKPGCFLNDGIDRSGETLALDIGIPSAFYPAWRLDGTIDQMVERVPAAAQTSPGSQPQPGAAQDISRGNATDTAASGNGVARSAVLPAKYAGDTGTELPRPSRIGVSRPASPDEWASGAEAPRPCPAPAHASGPRQCPALMEAADVRAWLPPRQRNQHKGMNGHLLIVAGSTGMAGAAALAARSALRSGAGLVTVACPASVLPIVQTLCPCAMAVPLAETDGAISGAAVDALRAALAGKHAVVCGCGLSRRASPDVVAAVLDSGLPALLDADALNLIAASPALMARLRPHHLITPYPGEAARLMAGMAKSGACPSMPSSPGKAPPQRPDAVLPAERIPGAAANPFALTGDPIADAFALSHLGCQALLKGCACVIPAGGRAVISASGSCGMARGGSGDCLSGIIGALMASRAARRGALSGTELAACAAVGSEIHGRAGEIAEARLGFRGMCAEDIVDALPEALRQYQDAAPSSPFYEFRAP